MRVLVSRLSGLLDVIARPLRRVEVYREQSQCDPRDLGVYAQVRAPFTGAATVFIYDKVPGGIGFSEKLYDAHDLLLRAALDHVARCGCQDGCPGCVGARSNEESATFGTRTTRQLLEALARRASART
jgi:DEAD/DEAH box helicase domain-containing protein